ncbi:MAG: hypothetical protein ABJB16_14960 [Saprospiraceae bacterium]
MKSLLHILVLLLPFHLWAWSLYAQPANDDCAGAYDVVVSDFEENVILTILMDLHKH